MYTKNYCGPPGFTGYSSPYRKTCFQSPFLQGPESSNYDLNCIKTYAHRGNCIFDNECDSNTCDNGQCAPAALKNPRIIGTSSRKNYNDVQCKNDVIFVQRDGKAIEPFCPIPYEPGTMPVCKQTYQNLWQCDQYKTNPRMQSEFEKCKRMESCFIYDVPYNNTSETYPVSVRMTPFCISAAESAVKQTASRCTSC